MAIEEYENRTTHTAQASADDRSSLASRCCQLTEDSMRENPVGTTLAAFGLGVGLGAVVGMLLAEPATRDRRQTAEALGRRMLDSIAEALPDPVRRYVT